MGNESMYCSLTSLYPNFHELLDFPDFLDLPGPGAPQTLNLFPDLPDLLNLP